MNFLNFRLLVWTLVLLLLIGGGVGGVIWYTNRPDYVYQSAVSYFNKAEEAENRNDKEAAKTNYSYADQKLKNLLEKTPSHVQGALLRYRTLNRMAGLAAADENVPLARSPKAAEMLHESDRSLDLAARDANYFDAQCYLLGRLIRDERYPEAASVAENVLKNQDAKTDIPEPSDYIFGAHYVRTRAALDQKPPLIESALEHIQASKDLQARQQKTFPRWRMYGLELVALQAKIDREQAAANRLQGKARQDANVLLAAQRKELSQRIEEGLAQLTKEMEKAPDGQKPLISRLSTTDADGFQRFLPIALKDADNKGELTERAKLFLTAAETIVANQPAPPAYREAVKIVGDVSDAVVRADPQVRPNEAALAEVKTRATAFFDQAGKDKVAVQPDVFLQLAQAQTEKRKLQDALEFVTKGLEAAKAQQLPDNNNTVLQLHRLGAQILLHLRQDSKADTHLAALKKHGKADWLVHYLQGRAALADGRLEQAVQELAQVKMPEQFSNLELQINTAQALMGLGRYAQALPLLRKVEAAYANPDKLSADERVVKAEVFPQSQLDLWMLMNLLALQQWEAALPYKEKLKDLGEAADVATANAYIGYAAARRRANDPEVARKSFDAARDVLRSARKLYPASEPLAQSELLLALADPGALATPAMLAGQGLIFDEPLRLGRAEQVLKAFADKQDKLAPKLRYAAWLWARGEKKRDEARALLDGLEKQFPAEADDLKRFRTQLALFDRGTADEAARLMQSLETNANPDRLTDLMLLQGYIKAGKLTEAEARVKQALGRHEGDAELLYVQGLLDLNAGRFREASGRFERAMQYTRFRSAAQQELSRCLAGWAEKGSLTEAREVAARLAREFPDEPQLMLVNAQLARGADRLTGAGSMQDYLGGVKAALRSKGIDASIAAYLAANEWNLAGRPDEARKELDVALKAEPPLEPAVVLAGRLAVARGDWNEALRLGAVLSKIRGEALDPALWRAAAAEAKGQTDDAAKEYREIIRQAGKAALGYLGLAGLYERKKDYAKALEALAPFEKEVPDDASALRMRVRLLSRLNRQQDAEAGADAILKKLPELVDKQLARANLAPPKDEAEKQERAKTRDEAVRVAEMVLLLAAASGFEDAADYDRAQGLFERALALAGKAPDARRKTDETTVRTRLARLWLNRGMAEKDVAKRKAAMQESVKLYRDVLKERPADAVAGNNLAWVLSQEFKDNEAALLAAKKLREGVLSGEELTGDRLSLDVLDTLGVVYRAADQCDKSVALFEQAAKRYENEPDVWLHLAKSQACLGQVEKARITFQRAVRVATEELAKTPDAGRKAKLEAALAAARAELSKGT